jgi:hypothetical protein
LAVLASLALSACSGAPNQAGAEKAEVGELGMSLLSVSPQGITYRLRNANFDITPEYYYWYYSTPEQPTPESVSVTSETDPDATSINLSLEQGYYYVYLNTGWYIERVEADGTATEVEAQLLSGNTSYLYVYPHSTSWASFNFGIGDRELWFNGDAQITINVYENPDDYYGYPYPSSAVDGGAPMPSMAPPAASPSATPAPAIDQ